MGLSVESKIKLMVSVLSKCGSIGASIYVLVAILREVPYLFRTENPQLCSALPTNIGGTWLSINASFADILQSRAYLGQLSSDPFGDAGLNQECVGIPPFFLLYIQWCCALGGLIVLDALRIRYMYQQKKPSGLFRAIFLLQSFWFDGCFLLAAAHYAPLSYNSQSVTSLFLPSPPKVSWSWYRVMLTAFFVQSLVFNLIIVANLLAVCGRAMKPKWPIREKFLTLLWFVWILCALTTGGMAKAFNFFTLYSTWFGRLGLPVFSITAITWHQVVSAFDIIIAIYLGKVKDVQQKLDSTLHDQLL